MFHATADSRRNPDTVGQKKSNAKYNRTFADYISFAKEMVRLKRPEFKGVVKVPDLKEEWGITIAKMKATAG